MGVPRIGGLGFRTIVFWTLGSILGSIIEGKYHIQGSHRDYIGVYRTMLRTFPQYL